MDKNTIQLFEKIKDEMNELTIWVWDKDKETTISVFSKFNKFNWNEEIIYPFFSKINIPGDYENDCWIWNACKTKNGYGMFRRNLAHRKSYEFFNGKIPNELNVQHSCNNPSCVNPFHLSTGTQLENMQKRSNDGRTASGEHCGGYKFNKKTLYNILLLIENNEIKNRSDFQLKVNKVSYDYIIQILNGEYRHDVSKFFDLPKLKNKIHKSHFTDKQVIEIRTRLKNGETCIVLSKKFNCNINTILNIKNYKTHKYI